MNHYPQYITLTLKSQEYGAFTGAKAGIPAAGIAAGITAKGGAYGN